MIGNVDKMSDFVRINVNIVMVIWIIIISLVQFNLYIYSNKIDEIKFIHECKKSHWIWLSKIKFLVYISNHIRFYYYLTEKKHRGQLRCCSKNETEEFI